MGFNLKDYEQVKERIARFLNDFPDGRIVTSIESLSEDGKTVIFKAMIFRNSDDQAKGLPLATGFAMEKEGTNPVNRTSFLENSETSSVGRAMSNANYILGNRRPSFEEMSKVVRMNAESNSSSGGSAQSESGSDRIKLIEELRVQFKSSNHPQKHRFFDNLIQEFGKDLKQWPEEVLHRFGDDLSLEVSNEAA